MTTEQRQVVAGRYDLVREVGRGGMGAVWLGRDTVLGRDVALKQIGMMPGANSPDLGRAEREARLAARLNHPHVVAVYDLVEEPEGTWLVMEYVEGITLSAAVQRDGAFEPDEAAWLARQAADALAAAHQAGIVHRDVKPSNMLVTPSGEVKLTDFGIARAEADASLTQTGLVTGSPAYLAPEVASGASATEASDVWSLGATLFHLMAGHPPYDVTDNLMGALYRIVHEEPPRLTDAGWLAPVLDHTMARDPADRWSMEQVRDFLARAHEPELSPVPLAAFDDQGTRVLQPSMRVAVPPVSPVAPAPTRRSPWPWVAALVLLVAAGAVVAAVLAGTHGSPSASPSSHHGAGSPSSGSSSSDESTGSTGSSANGRSAQAAAMRSFITTYLSTVTSDPQRSWTMLTPAFQRESHGFGHYQGFWRTISSATPHDVRADPSGMTVSYGVDYVKSDGGTESDFVTLRLVKDGSTYLIDGES